MPNIKNLGLKVKSSIFSYKMVDKKVLGIIAVLLLLAPIVSAQEIVGSSCGTVSPDSRDLCCERKGYDYWSEEENVCAVNSGITPDNPLYGLDTAIEHLRLRLMRNEENKANYRLRIAEERISEMNAMAAKNRLNAMERARVNYEEHIQQLEQVRNRLRAGQVERLKERMQRHTTRLQRIRNKIPEQARQGLDTAIQNSNRAEQHFRGNQ